MPSAVNMKTGRRLWISSEETSMSRLTKPSAQMLWGVPLAGLAGEFISAFPMRSERQGVAAQRQDLGEVPYRDSDYTGVCPFCLETENRAGGAKSMLGARRLFAEEKSNRLWCSGCVLSVYPIIAKFTKRILLSGPPKIHFLDLENTYFTLFTWPGGESEWQRQGRLCYSGTNKGAQNVLAGTGR
jgi:hypothetical protein